MTTSEDRTLDVRRKRRRVVHQAIVNHRVDPRRAADQEVRPIDWSWAEMLGIDASDGHLQAADLSHADLSQSWFDRANLSRSRLVNATLDHSSLVEADLSDADLLNAGLDGADLRGASLRNANLAGVNLRHAKLLNADLTDADLTDANLAWTNFVSNDDFEPADENAEVKGLTQRQLDSASAFDGARPMIDGLLDAETGEPLVWRGDVGRG